MSIDAYLAHVARAESPDGRDNVAGSGAYSRFQFMPATATAYAARTPWGAGLTPDQVKAAVTADPGKAVELAKMFTTDNEGVLAKAGLPVNDGTRFATHRFGPAGGVSLLRADANMPVVDWVNSVQWGNGVSPAAVIQQNGLDRYTSVGDLRNRFIFGQIGAGPTPVGAEPTPPAPAEPQPAPGPVRSPIQAAFTPATPSFGDVIGSLFARPQGGSRGKQRQRREMLFA